MIQIHYRCFNPLHATRSTSPINNHPYNYIHNPLVNHVNDLWSVMWSSIHFLGSFPWSRSIIDVSIPYTPQDQQAPLIIILIITSFINSCTDPWSAMRSSIPAGNHFYNPVHIPIIIHSNDLWSTMRSSILISRAFLWSLTLIYVLILDPPWDHQTYLLTIFITLYIFP